MRDASCRRGQTDLLIGRQGMKKHRAALASFAAIAVVALCAPANASVIRVDFTGVFTSTTDSTGSVFGNGTGANSGIGTQISGFALWDLDKPGFLGPGS